jgi:hypothetical protein
VLEASDEALAALPGFDAETVDAVKAAARGQIEAVESAAPTETGSGSSEQGE